MVSFIVRMRFDAAETEEIAVILRELQANNAITRRGGEGKSREYMLTPSGQKLEQVIFMLAAWGQEHRAISMSPPSAER